MRQRGYVDESQGRWHRPKPQESDVRQFPTVQHFEPKGGAGEGGTERSSGAEAAGDYQREKGEQTPVFSVASSPIKIRLLRKRSTVGMI